MSKVPLLGDLVRCRFGQLMMVQTCPNTPKRALFVGDVCIQAAGCVDLNPKLSDILKGQWLDLMGMKKLHSNVRGGG
jgi:hypothetical protein